MSLLLTRIDVAKIEARIDNEWELVDVQRNVGGIRYEIFGMEFFLGGEMQTVLEWRRKEPFKIWMGYSAAEMITDELKKKAASSIGSKIQTP